MVNNYTFLRIGRSMLGANGRESRDRDFKGLFGVPVVVCMDVWQQCDFVGEGMKPKHLMWGLLMLKIYGNQSVLAAVASTTRKTFRKHAWKAVKLIAARYPDVVSACRHFCF